MKTGTGGRRWICAMGGVALAVAACSGSGDAGTESADTTAQPTTTTEFVPGTLPEPSIATYESEELGFAIDYPADWNVDEETESGIVGFYGQFIDGDRFVENYNVAVVDIADDVGLDELVRLDAPRLALGVDEFAAVGGGDTVIDGVPAITVVFDGTAEGVELRFLRLISVRDGRAYEFTFAASREEFDNFLPVIDQMLSSMRFLG